ncbi:MAG: penicillin acylase family protein [Calothrix sp. SM1_5_4]|nr:penicillin acylase family protein [Calothrix sp. SM1_5_4]
MPAAGNGSNNWAVGPEKSATGHSILANDTHLGLTLPNIWYENQLSCPEFNVYGVALISVPGIINGFNSEVAWGPTNGTTDALDYYETEFEDESSLKYRFHGRLEAAEVKRETVLVRGGDPLSVDVIWTKLGVLMHREGRYGLVANWMGHRPGLELKAVRGLYAAKTAAQCLDSFTDWFVPLQNFICADRGRVSILHAGRVPRREIGEGRFIMDGQFAKDPFASTQPSPRIDNAPVVFSGQPKILGPIRGRIGLGL